MSDWESEPEDAPQIPVAPQPVRGERRFYNRGRAENNFSYSGGRGYGNWQSLQQRNKKIINIPSNKVGRVIGKGGTKIRDLQYESGTKIKVGDSSGNDTDITIFGTDYEISKADGMIKDLISRSLSIDSEKPQKKLPASNGSDDTDNMSYNFTCINEKGIEVTDWPRIWAELDKHKKERYAKLPPIVKNFYVEDAAIAAMSPAEVASWRLSNNDIQVRRTFGEAPDSEDIPNPVLSFEQAFRMYPDILCEIKKQGFTTPSPIQSQAWPIILKGEDMIGIAQTGTGKTLAFLLPALLHIDGQPMPREERPGPTVLILAPTRELASQIEKEVLKYQYKGIKSVCLYGGVDRGEQIDILEKGVDIVIATPGRLNDLINANHLKAINFSFIVLDEADRMLDMGFEPQIKISLFDARPDRQCIMTSATWPPGVCRLAETYMKNPIQVNVGSLDLAAVHTVTQKILFMEEDDKGLELYKFIENMDPNDKVIVFIGKKFVASHVYIDLISRGIQCQALHGDRDQMERETALEEMLNGSVNILVATDVASRGIDIKDLTHVVNFDFPNHIEEYVHRIGRTGRAGRSGLAVSYMTKKDWAHAGELIRILEEANQDVPIELRCMAKRFDVMKANRGNHRGRGKKFYF